MSCMARAVKVAGPTYLNRWVAESGRSNRKTAGDDISFPSCADGWRADSSYAYDCRTYHAYACNVYVYSYETDMIYHHPSDADKMLYRIIRLTRVTL